MSNTSLQKRECIFLLLFTQFIRASNFWHHKWWWPQYGNLCFRLIYLYFIVLPKLSNFMLHWINEVKLQISFYPETQNPWKFMWPKEFLKYRRRKAILIQSQTCPVREKRTLHFWVAFFPSLHLSYILLCPKENCFPAWESHVTCMHWQGRTYSSFGNVSFFSLSKCFISSILSFRYIPSWVSLLRLKRKN